MNTIVEGYPTQPEAMVKAVDLENAEEEKAQQPQVSERILEYRGIRYKVIDHHPSIMRTYTSERGERIVYPHMLMVHGVASDARYFDPLCHDMARLGIASSVIELPRYATAGLHPSKLIDWQVDAVANTYEILKETERAESQIVMAGHSRGAIVATLAAHKLYDNDFYRPEGLVLLAPAGFDKIADGKMHKAALLLGPLVMNSLRGGVTNRARLLQNTQMMLSVVLSNLPQSYAEIQQAISMDITHLFSEMPKLDILVPFAEDDEFIKYEELYHVALLHDNVSVLTVDSSHLLENPQYKDIISLADPRLLTGQLLAFLMSKIPNYTPKTYHPESGSVARLSRTNIQQYMANQAIQTAAFSQS